MVGVSKAAHSLLVVRAREYRIDSGAQTRQLSNQDFLNAFELVPTVVATRYAGLVADDYNGHISVVGRRDCLRGSIDQDDIFDAMQILNLFDNHPVAVEKERRPSRFPS